MNPKEWVQFLADLKSVGYGDVVDKFEKTDKEIVAKMEEMEKKAQQRIQVANLTQLVYDAVKECRYVYYSAGNGGRIIH
jgi:hypothetical protein